MAKRSLAQFMGDTSIIQKLQAPVCRLVGRIPIPADSQHTRFFDCSACGQFLYILDSANHLTSLTLSGTEYIKTVATLPISGGVKRFLVSGNGMTLFTISQTPEQRQVIEAWTPGDVPGSWIRAWATLADDLIVAAATTDRTLITQDYMGVICVEGVTRTVIATDVEYGFSVNQAGTLLAYVTTLGGNAVIVKAIPSGDIVEKYLTGDRAMGVALSASGEHLAALLCSNVFWCWHLTTGAVRPQTVSGMGPSLANIQVCADGTHVTGDACAENWAVFRISNPSTEPVYERFYGSRTVKFVGESRVIAWFLLGKEAVLEVYSLY